jgi:hypothetical protein
METEARPGFVWAPYLAMLDFSCADDPVRVRLVGLHGMKSSFIGFDSPAPFCPPPSFDSRPLLDADCGNHQKYRRGVLTNHPTLSVLSTSLLGGTSRHERLRYGFA